MTGQSLSLEHNTIEKFFQNKKVIPNEYVLNTYIATKTKKSSTNIIQNNYVSNPVYKFVLLRLPINFPTEILDKIFLFYLMFRQKTIITRFLGYFYTPLAKKHKIEKMQLEMFSVIMKNPEYLEQAMDEDEVFYKQIIYHIIDSKEGFLLKTLEESILLSCLCIRHKCNY